MLSGTAELVGFGGTALNGGRPLVGVGKLEFDF